MPKILFALLLVVSSFVLSACGRELASSQQLSPPVKQASAIRLATHNVHYILLNKASGPWSIGDWENRKSALYSAVRSLNADIIGFQEMESFSGGDDGSVNLALKYVLEHSPQYKAAAAGDWRIFPSTQPILYDWQRFDVLDQGWFFFSETPDVIYSRTFNGSYPAFSSWAKFKVKATNQKFYVFNVHFEYKSRKNRLLSASLVTQRIASIAGQDAVFLLGDLNALHGSRTMKLLEAANLTFMPVEGSTYHFNRGIELFGAIDHIAHSSHSAVVGGPFVLRERFGGRWPSDHYPVTADFTFNTSE